MAKKSLEELNKELQSKNPNLELKFIDNKYYLYCNNCKSLYCIDHLKRVTRFVSGSPKCVICEKFSKIPLTAEIYQIKLDYLNKDRYELILEKFPEKVVSKTPVYVLCKKCNNEVTVTLDRLTAGNNCKECAKIESSEKQKMTKEEFLEKLSKIDEGNIELIGEFKDIQTKTKFKCQFGHTWDTLPRHILYDHTSCPECYKEAHESEGEKRIRKYLTNNNIKYKQYCRDFEDCIYKKQLEMDFYLEDYNLVVEFDGYLHFKNDYDPSEQIEQVKRDAAKNEYCKNNNINLLRINYTDIDNIENILDEYFKK